MVSAIWSVFGGILGLVWGMLVNRDIHQDAVRNIVVGAVGGAVGGFLAHWNATPSALTFGSVAMASVGAIGLSTLVSWLAKAGIHRVRRVRDETP